MSAVGPRAFLNQEASELSTVFGRFARWCGASTSCALHGKNVAAVWDDLLARAVRTPIPAPHAIPMARPEITPAWSTVNGSVVQRRTCVVTALVGCNAQAPPPGPTQSVRPPRGRRDQRGKPASARNCARFDGGAFGRA